MDQQILFKTMVDCTVLCLYLDERSGVQENTSIRSKEFLRAEDKVKDKVLGQFSVNHFERPYLLNGKSF